MNPVIQMEKVMSGSFHNTAGMMVRRQNQVVYENYYQGYTSENRVHIASATKSILSILIGMAAEQGRLDIHQPILEYFPEYEPADSNKTICQITIRDMLTMTAPYQCKTEPYQKVMTGTGWVRAALDILGGSGSIGEFRYSPMIGIQVMAGILTRALDQSIHTFANERLFAPLGIQVEQDILLKSKEENMEFLKARDISGWVVDPEGINTAGWGLTLTVNDMAKIGQLYLNGGIWEGEQLVSREWITESTREQSRCKEWKLSYGYLWWVPDEKNHIYAAMGDGGNIIYVNEARELVIAIACSYMPQAKDRLKLIQKYIEPAFAS